MASLRIFYLSIFFVFALLGLGAQEVDVIVKKEPDNQEIFKIEEYPNLQLTELTLKNGMRLVLKKTDDDSEICIRLAALGGYAAANLEDRISGELAANLVMESGIGPLCPDKLSSFLYAHSIEFNLKIEPFVRSIDISFPEESLEPALSLITSIFTIPNFKKEAFPSVIAKKSSELTLKREPFASDDILHLETIPEKQFLYPLQVNNLEKANFNKARQFFLEAFSNPSDFVCVIAGNIDIEKTKKLSIEYFSALPFRNSERSFTLPRDCRENKEIAISTQPLLKTKESLVRVALPLQMQLDSDKLEQLEIICQLVETRLRNGVKSPSSSIKKIDVWYELPLYPSLKHPWMTIQFHAINNQIKPSIDWIFDELKSIDKKGVSAKEIHMASKVKQQSLQLWAHDNDYWIVLLSNYYLWQWKPHSIGEKFKNPVIINSREIDAILHKALLMNEYIRN